MNETKTFEAGPYHPAEWLGGVKGAPHAVLMGAMLLAVILALVIPLFWKRDLLQH